MASYEEAPEHDYPTLDDDYSSSETSESEDGDAIDAPDGREEDEDDEDLPDKWCNRCHRLRSLTEFPLKADLERALSCAECTLKKRENDTKRRQAKAEEEEKEVKHRRAMGKDIEIPHITWSQFSKLLCNSKGDAFQLHAYLLLKPSQLGLAEGATGEAIAAKLAQYAREFTGYRFNSKGRERDKIRTHIYFCAQNEREQSKSKLTDDVSKRRARLKMERFPCDGYLRIKVNDNHIRQASDALVVEVRMTHFCPHTPYTDISIPEHVANRIASMKDSTASKIWKILKHENPTCEFTQKQVYQCWLKANEASWRLSEDQVESAVRVLAATKAEGLEVEHIPVPEEAGISTVAFTFQDLLGEFGETITEIAMDSTWKTNALGHELYAVVGEVNGEALPLAFVFIRTDGTAAEGAKQRVLEVVVRRVHMGCPNISFVLHDKDTTETNALRTVIPSAKHQLCYWHAIKYLEERLAEDKLPAKYDPRKAHQVCDFIDPTWAPGVTSGWLEDGVHQDDAECEPPDIDEADETTYESESPPPTCLPPVFILVDGETRVPVYPAPPKMVKKDLPIFCEKSHRPIIVEKFRRHLHQHPDIPFDDEDKTFLDKEEIYYGAVLEMYRYCFKNGLAQVWAYLWNRWYTPKQWKLWARSADEAIPRLKTTMIVESLWRVIKHRDLAQFNRPRLDLVTHRLIVDILPTLKRRLANARNQLRQGRPKALTSWQRDFRADWRDFSRVDEHRLVERELEWLKKPKKTKGRTERLEQIREEYTRPRGDYDTDVHRWTCSCPAYLISRFLLCKHIVREVNNMLDDRPLTDLNFFLTLRRENYPPYYTIPGIHYENNAASAATLVPGEVHVLGRATTIPSDSVQGSSRPATPFSDVDVFDDEDEHDSQASEGAYDASSTTDTSKEAAPEVGSRLGMAEDADIGDEMTGEEKDNERVYYSGARRANLKRCWEALMDVIEAEGGVHPKLAARLDHKILDNVELIGGDILRHKRRKTSVRTWKDSNSNTIYLD